MVARFALAFSIATVVGLLGAAGLRAASRRGAAGVRRRGALAVAAGIVAGSALLPELSGRIAVVVVVALALALFAAASATRSPGRGVRLAVLVAAALVAVAAGVRLEWSGIGVLDVAGTVVLIVAVANGLRWSDATEGLAPALGAAIAVGAFALAAFGDQGALAVLAAALGGACVGLVAYALPPASVYLNWDGALPIGYLAAVLAIEIQPSIGAPGGLAVVPLLVAVPLIEITVVPLGQLRHRKRLGPVRRDHRANRLRVLGLPRWAALPVLVSAQLVLGAVAVFVGRGVLEPARGLALGGAVVAVLVIAACSKAVHGDVARGFSARVRLVVLGAVGLLALLVVPAGLAAARTRNSVDTARAMVERALDAARDGEAETARRQFAAAAREFEDIRDTLENPVVSASLVVPVVGPNLRATRDVARIGADLARTGERTAARVDPDRLEVVAGTVPLAEVERVTPDLAHGAEQLEKALARLDDVDDTVLIGPVHDAIAEVDEELSAASREADNGVAAARLAPAIFGGEAPRRYFVAVQNPAEQRATGGFIGQWGILTAQTGEVDLESMEGIAVLNPGMGEPRTLTASADYRARYAQFQPERTWQNINMSPDFPTVAQVIADQYRQATGEQIDGILAVDPAGLAALLELTGPVPVAPWP
ncbi:MAG TPA: DUF4012 domain-containing protein, partial [Acidimicrobiia bacterium]|nr:DUF4012 domain-containing protein [Acidimicrobiia bacterium]